MSINLREELKLLLKKHWDHVIIRHMTTTVCGCMSLREASRIADPQCPNCDGAGYIFEEHLVKCKSFWSQSPVAHTKNFNYGLGYSNGATIYLEASDFNMQFKKNDIVYNIERDLEGNIRNPIVRLEKWLVIDNNTLRLDTGKVEFIKLYIKPNVV